MLKLSQVAADELPKCFGKKFESTAPECVGGNDPAYDDEEGGHNRPRCDMLSSCAARTQALASRGSEQIVPVQNAVRPSTTFSPPATVAQPYRPGYPQHVQQHAAYPTHVQPQYMHPQVGMPQMVPVNYAMPQYLTVREDTTNGQGLMKRLGLEVLRSLGKSAGHTIAHYFDAEMFGRRG